ncbi:MAG: hypothetical protein ATN31_04740 [Candidatus Epulonipiscioides saccharophilum]|nr:MAG: hypothetical protein ATN31_04740 [Epulopiscium sp. AS2M-Bin001]
MNKHHNRHTPDLLSQGLVFGVLICLTLLFTVFTGGKFIKVTNLITIVSQVVPYALLGFGMTFVLIIGGIDLSVGSILGFGGIICAKMITLGIPIWLSIIISLCFGALVGFINGYCVTKLSVVPFIVTLGTQFAFRGLTQLIGDGKPVSIQAMKNKAVVTQFIWLGNGEIFGIPVPIIIMIITGIILGILLSKTAYGRRVYAVGSNEEAARLSGINIINTKLIAYIISGLTSTIAGILLAAKLASAQSNAGTGYELEGIAVAVIGGTSVTGGVGGILGTVIGSFIMGVLRNGLNLLKVNAFIQMIVIGSIIVLSVWYDTHRRKKIQL